MNRWTTRGLPIALLLATTPLLAQSRPAAPQPRPVQAAPAATPAARTTPAPATLLRDTQALFDGYVRDGKMPGIVGAFGVGPAPTQFVAAGAIATDPGAPRAGPDTIWRIYSMTKPITGMAAMMLVEDGRLRLDQPIADFLPEYRTMRVAAAPDTSLDARPARTPITVRHLLTHTAGLGYSISARGPLLREYERLGLVPAALNPALESAIRTTRPTNLREFARRAAQVPLVAEPGTRWHYSMGLDVLAAVIERAAGMPYERFLQTRLFDPLGMRSTTWSVPAADVHRLATNYIFAGDRLVPIDSAATSVFLQPPSFPYGGAGLLSTARDYDRFLAMLANGGELDGRRVMKAETVALGMSNLLPAGVSFTGIGGGTGGTQGGGAAMGFGAGGSVYLADLPGGASRGTYGWGGAAGTIAFVDPARRMRGTVMVQYFPAERWPLRQEVPAALARDAARLHPAR